MGWWRENYPDKVGNKDFVQGAIIAIRLYHRWEGERRIVGYEMSMEEEIEEVKKDLEYEDKEASNG